MDERSFEVGIRQAEMGVTNDAAILENGKAAQNGDLSIAHTVASNTVSSGTSTTAVNAASERIENELNQDDHSITSDAPPLQAGLSVSNLPFEVTAPKKTKKRKARPGKTLRAVTGFESKRLVSTV